MLGRPGPRLTLRGVAALLHVAADVAVKSLLRLAVHEGHKLLFNSGDSAAVAGQDAVGDSEHLRVDGRRHGT